MVIGLRSLISKLLDKLLPVLLETLPLAVFGSTVYWLVLRFSSLCFKLVVILINACLFTASVGLGY